MKLRHESWALTPVEESLGSLARPFGGPAWEQRVRAFFTMLALSAEPSFLADRLGLERTIADRRLLDLQRSGMVRKVRRGRAVFYTVARAVSLSVHGGSLRVALGVGRAVFVVTVLDEELDTLGLRPLVEALSPVHLNDAVSRNGTAGAVSRPGEDRTRAGGAPRASRLPSAHGPL